MSRVGPEHDERLDASVRRRVRTGRAPGSALIAVAAWLLALIGGGALFVSFSAQYAYILAARRQDAASVIEAPLMDLLMIVFTLLALGLSRAGQPARAERALILLCAVASAYMNVSAADVASPRSVAAYTAAPLALAVVVDRVVAVIRRHVLADQQPSAWTTVGRTSVAAARIAGLVLLYCLRFALAAPETARGLRRMVLAATPLPAPPEAPQLRRSNRPVLKKAISLALYRAHPDYGDRRGLDRDTYHAQLADLRQWADTVLRQHYGGYELRECWPRHIHAIWELSTLAAEWHRTYSGTRPNLARALEFYDRWLPGAMRRITGITRTCLPQCATLRSPGDWAARPRYR